MTDLSQDWRLHRHSLTAHSLDEAHQAHQRPAHAVPGLRCCLLVASVREKWMRCGAGCGTLIIIRDTTVQSPSLPSWGCELSSTRAPLLQSCQSNVASSHQCDSPQLIPHPSSSPASPGLRRGCQLQILTNGQWCQWKLGWKDCSCLPHNWRFSLPRVSTLQIDGDAVFYRLVPCKSVSEGDNNSQR